MDIADLKREMDASFVGVEQRIAEEGEKTRRHFADEGEKTRRHFDVVAEQMKAERNLVLDHSLSTGEALAVLRKASAADHHALVERLDDHEKRLTKLEETDHTDA